MQAKTNPVDYRVLSNRLDEVLSALQSPDVTIDEAVTLHKEGHDLIVQLEKYLKATEVRITKLKAS
jgi:exodeoxyribonuclease VII small subunit